MENLPEIGKTHPHYKEWLIRKHSFERLKAYLKSKNKSLTILEVGCGNGWLSNQLSLHLHCQVTGLDINHTELQQASRVFKKNTECDFIAGEMSSNIFINKKYDAIIFAASLQYFCSLNDVLNDAKKLLKAGGDILILDTHFYPKSIIEEARQRSKSHFESLGFPGMSAMYFHHSLEKIKEFNPLILYDPFSFRSRFFKNKSPFYMMSIRKD